tara:strand:- start:6623 stop:7078 length:456 start_codon:yes stop_codon:yes gene_type:complete
MCGVSSCRSDGDDDDPLLPYIGTWERTESSEEGSINQELVITETTFTVTMSMTVDEEWVDLMFIKGTYSVSNNIFMLTITQFGIIMEEGGGMVYFTPDDLEWDELLEDELEIEDSFEAKFVVTGNQLNLIIDENGDGLFDPIMEGETFTKK